MAKLNWKVLIKKRAGVTQGVPPGKEDLAWVTNTVTLIYGERDAVLVEGEHVSVEVEPDADEVTRIGRGRVRRPGDRAGRDHAPPGDAVPADLREPGGGLDRRPAVGRTRRRRRSQASPK